MTNCVNKLLKAYNENILQRRLEDLDLSVRSFNCIKKGGVDVVKDFAFYTEEQILNIRNLGKKSIIEIATKLVALGIHETAWEYKFWKLFWLAYPLAVR